MVGKDVQVASQVRLDSLAAGTVDFLVVGIVESLVVVGTVDSLVVVGTVDSLIVMGTVDSLVVGTGGHCNTHRRHHLLAVVSH